MSIRQLPSPRWTIPGNSGVVAAGYYVYTYQPGTSTPKATYTDHTGATHNTNPIVLDARGEANIWWDGQYKVLVYTGDKDAGGVLVWSQDNYGEGTSAVLQGNFNLVLNGSFEQDTNGDDLPDDWTIVEYTDGTVERDSLESTHGAYSLKFTSVGTGGGIADSSLFAVQEARIVPVSFALKSSIATVHNRVDVVWLTGGGAVLSSTTLYDDDTTNPVNWTHFNYNATPPVNARFGKFRFYGCHEDNAQAGMTWIDNIQVEATTVVAGLFPNVTQAVTATHDELNLSTHLTGVSGNVQEQIDGKQAIADDVANVANCGTLQLSNSSIGSVLSLDTIDLDVTYTVGRTGSGADLIWTALDSLPASARGIYVFAEAAATATATGAQKFEVGVGGSTSLTYIVSTNRYTVAGTFGVEGGCGLSSLVDGKFRVRIDVNGTRSGSYLQLRGWLE